MPIVSIEHNWYPWGWSLRADPEFVERKSVKPDGSASTRIEHSGRWDIYLAHVNGSRVPPGKNLHAGCEPESERLANALEKGGR